MTTQPDRTEKEPEPVEGEFEYAILYTQEGESLCVVRWAKTATKAVEEFERELGPFRLNNIHKL